MIYSNVMFLAWFVLRTMMVSLSRHLKTQFQMWTAKQALRVNTMASLAARFKLTFSVAEEESFLLTFDLRRAITSPQEE